MAVVVLQVIVISSLVAVVKLALGANGLVYVIPSKQEHAEQQRALFEEIELLENYF